MRYIILLFSACIFISEGVLAQSNLLETVKKNPKEAQALCNYFRELNSQGLSAGSPEAISRIAKRRNLNLLDAEILSIYVIGLNCPEVK
tara:strand:- start:687 stop:953 length:267 start_codon:yes stop_codon:yes gene_type:complete